MSGSARKPPFSGITAYIGLSPHGPFCHHAACRISAAVSAYVPSRWSICTWRVKRTVTLERTTGPESMTMAWSHFAVLGLYLATSSSLEAVFGWHIQTTNSVLLSESKAKVGRPLRPLADSGITDCADLPPDCTVSKSDALRPSLDRSAAIE